MKNYVLKFSRDDKVLMCFPDKISQLLTVRSASAGQDVQDLVVKLSSAIRQMQTAQRNGLYVLIQ